MTIWVRRQSENLKSKISRQSCLQIARVTTFTKQVRQSTERYKIYINIKKIRWFVPSVFCCYYIYNKERSFFRFIQDKVNLCMLGTASILLQRLFQEYRLFHEVRPQQEEQYPYNTYPLRIRQRSGTSVAASRVSILIIRSSVSAVSL